MVLVTDADAAIEFDGRSRRCCSNRRWRCKWLVAGMPAPASLSCALVRRRPDPDDTIAMEKLAEARTNLRRLVFQLTDLGLPITPHYEREGGLAFELLSSYSNNEKIIFGQAKAIVTIELAEPSTFAASHCGSSSATVPRHARARPSRGGELLPERPGGDGP